MAISEKVDIVYYTLLVCGRFHNAFIYCILVVNSHMLSVAQ